MKKTTNKGFSLVELIIVVAIMAILIGVLAPQYIKYVEKSRKSADEDCADSLKNAAMTACTDDDYYEGITSTDTITFNKTNVTLGTANGSLSAALGEYFANWSTCRVKSKFYQSKSYKVTFTADASTGGLKAVGTWN